MDLTEKHDKNNHRFAEWALNNSFILQASYARSEQKWTSDIYHAITGKQTAMPHTINDDNYVDYFAFNSSGYRIACRGTLLEKNPGIKVILLVRDPRDCVLSLAKLYLPTDMPLATYIAAIVDYNTGWWSKTIGDFLSSNHIVVQYEHLCLNPTETLSRIFQFVDFNTNGDIDFEAIVKRLDQPKPYETGIERYTDYCLKWQSDPLWQQEYSDKIYDVEGEIMERFGYTSEGHNLRGKHVSRFAA